MLRLRSSSRWDWTGVKIRLSRLRTTMFSTVSILPLPSICTNVDVVGDVDGSALGIGVITSFICQQLNDRCKAGAATLAACASGQAAAAKATGGAAADAL